MRSDWEWPRQIGQRRALGGEAPAQRGLGQRHVASHPACRPGLVEAAGDQRTHPDRGTGIGRRTAQHDAFFQQPLHHLEHAQARHCGGQFLAQRQRATGAIERVGQVRRHPPQQVHRCRRLARRLGLRGGAEVVGIGQQRVVEQQPARLVVRAIGHRVREVDGLVAAEHHGLPRQGRDGGSAFRANGLDASADEDQRGLVHAHAQDLQALPLQHVGRKAAPSRKRHRALPGACRHLNAAAMSAAGATMAPLA